MLRFVQWGQGFLARKQVRITDSRQQLQRCSRTYTDLALRLIWQDPEGKYEALAKYARDLTAAARDGKLDPVIGRDDEIRRAIQILSRRTKNNPVLIGEPGVGKTAVAEGARAHCACACRQCAALPALRIVAGCNNPHMGMVQHCNGIALPAQKHNHCAV